MSQHTKMTKGTCFVNRCGTLLIWQNLTNSEDDRWFTWESKETFLSSIIPNSLQRAKEKELYTCLLLKVDCICAVKKFKCFVYVTKHQQELFRTCLTSVRAIIRKSMSILTRLKRNASSIRNSVWPRENSVTVVREPSQIPNPSTTWVAF